MPTFNKSGNSPSAVNSPRGEAEIFDRAKRSAQESGCLIEVWGDHCCEWKKSVLKNPQSRWTKENGSRGGNHHGIDDQFNFRVLTEPVGNRPNDRGTIQHSCFCGDRR